MSTITPFELRKALAADPALPLVDVRTPAEFREVHVPQAVNEPLDALRPEALARAGRLSAGKPVYLLCHSGARAARAAERLSAAGFSDPVVVEGGTLAWIEAGFEVERSAKKAVSLERQVRIAAGALVLTGVLLSLWVHPGFLALAGFVGAGLIFAGVTDWCGMGLLLARLPWNR